MSSAKGMPFFFGEMSSLFPAASSVRVARRNGRATVAKAPANLSEADSKSKNRTRIVLLGSYNL